MNFKQQIFKYFPHIFVLLFFSGLAVFAWTEPSVTPPNPDPNVAVPLNTGLASQSKKGNLALNTDGALAYGLLVPFGSVGIGTTEPGSFLTVAGTIESTSGGVKFPDGTVQTTAGGGHAVFGNGSDGDVTVSASFTLGRDAMYNNLTINPGITLLSNGYTILVRNTLTLNGTISANGGAGGTPTAGSSGTGYLAGGRGGQGGQTGGNTGGGGGGGANSLIVAAQILAGNGSITAIGGIGGNAQYAFSGSSASGNPGGSVSRGSPGAGGDGGHGPSWNFFGGSPYAGPSGAGGQANLPVRTFLMIQAGGAGGGGGGAGTSWYIYSAGGGGGGGGGNLFIIYNSKTGSPTFSVAGGAGGAQSNGGSNGTAGQPGSIIEIAN